MCFGNLGSSTVINGDVIAEDNELTWPLARTNLALILENQEDQEEVHQLRLNISQNSFPFTFKTSPINPIKNK
jgi:hypothetical protein